MLVCRRAHRSHAADAFLEVAQEGSKLKPYAGSPA